MEIRSLHSRNRSRQSPQGQERQQHLAERGSTLPFAQIEPHIMPEFMCVQCFSCNTYQVQQIKKANKFQCRLCGEKQSVQKVFAVSGKAKDVRLVVQDMNMKRSEQGQAIQEGGNDEKTTGDDFRSERVQRDVNWDEFTTEAQDCGVFNENYVDTGENYVTCIPERKRKGATGIDSSRSKQSKTETTVSRTHPTCENETSERLGAGSIPSNTLNIAAARKREVASVKAGAGCAGGNSPSRPVTKSSAEPSVIDCKGKHSSVVNDATHATKGGDRLETGRRSVWESFLESEQNVVGGGASSDIDCESKWGGFVEEDGEDTKLKLPRTSMWGGDAVENGDDSPVFVTKLD